MSNKGENKGIFNSYLLESDAFISLEQFAISELSNKTKNRCGILLKNQLNEINKEAKLYDIRKRLLNKLQNKKAILN